MRLKMLELNFKWPEEVSLNDLRPLILDELAKHGEPLRWAIAFVEDSAPHDFCRQLRIEAVVIIA